MARRRRLEWTLRLSSVATVIALAAIALVAVRAIAVSHRVTTEALTADAHALEEAAELHALLYQKGFVSQYFLTHDARWLDELRRATPAFESWLARAVVSAQTPEAGEAAAQLSAEYGRYDAERSRAIATFQAGDEAGARKILLENNTHAEKLRDLTARLTDLRRAELATRLAEADRAWVRTLALLAAAVVLAIAAAAGVGYALARRVARQIEASRAQLADHRQRLAQAEKLSELGKLATMVAHELLNPLTGVKTAMQLLARSSPTAADLRRTSAEVDAEIGRVDRLARRLVSFARPLTPSLQPCALDEAVAGALQATRGEAAERGVEVHARVDDSLPIASADPELLMQVLVNLTLNACQAAPGGHVEISLRRDGEFSVIDVRDDGCGLPPDADGRLFQPFFTTRADGHGLGLAIAQNIALAHGGRIEARPNAPARGATFSLYLPQERAA